MNITMRVTSPSPLSIPPSSQGMSWVHPPIRLIVPARTRGCGVLKAFGCWFVAENRFPYYGMVCSLVFVFWVNVLRSVSLLLCVLYDSQLFQWLASVSTSS